MDPGDDGARWKGKQGERKELRRPAIAMQAGATDESSIANPEKSHVEDARSGLLSAGENDDSPLAQSSLSPYAKEFIPRPPSVLSPYAKEFTPSGEFTCTNHEELDSNHACCVTMMHQVIQEVTLSPASFDREFRNLTAMLNDSAVDSQVLNSIAEIIVHQGIVEPNFRYNAVRMCRNLIDDLHSDTNFRGIVLNACKDVLNKAKDLISTPEGQATCRGCALFLGEIFSQIQVHGERLQFVGEKITEILELLLTEPTSDNLKCVCQVIKFVGAHIEDQERASNENRQAPIMDRIIAQIDEYAVTIGHTLDKCIKGMLLAVVELRTANYGRRNHSPPVTNSTEIIPNSVTSDPIRYGPDGQQLTADEASFMDSVYNDVPNGDDYRFEENYESEDMDEEMCTAFEEFLREMPPPPP